MFSFIEKMLEGKKRPVSSTEIKIFERNPINEPVVGNSEINASVETKLDLARSDSSSSEYEGPYWSLGLEDVDGNPGQRAPTPHFSVTMSGMAEAMKDGWSVPNPPQSLKRNEERRKRLSK